MARRAGLTAENDDLVRRYHRTAWFGLERSANGYRDRILAIADPAQRDSATRALAKPRKKDLAGLPDRDLLDRAPKRGPLPCQETYIKYGLGERTN